MGVMEYKPPVTTQGISRLATVYYNRAALDQLKSDLAFHPTPDEFPRPLEEAKSCANVFLPGDMVGLR